MLKILLAGIFLIANLTIAQENLVKNGDFSQPSKDGTIVDWSGDKRAKIISIDETSTLLLNGSYCYVRQRISLKPEWKTLYLSMQMKGNDLKVGSENWKDGRLAMNFFDANDKRIGEWPNVFFLTGTTEWIDCKRAYNIPHGAVTLEIIPANYGKSGSVEFRDINITVSKIWKPIADMPLPDGAKNVWETSDSWKLKNQSREKISLNGLWRFIPETENMTDVPVEGKGWGWFKVPGIWPKAQGWDTSAPAQEFILPEGIKEKIDISKLEQAWYKREIYIPADWKDKKIILDFEMIQTHCAIYINGEEIGDIVFPGGEVDITSAVIPGKKATLAILHTARPLETATDTFMAPDRAFKSKSVLKFKGITGDLYLLSRPKDNYITDTHVITSTRENQITFESGIQNISGENFQITAQIFKDNKLVKTFESKLFSKGDLKDGRFKFSSTWKNPILWDTHTPENIYTAKISLKNKDIVDEQLPFSFGFREFWIEGRDLLLNGKRIHLRALFIRNIADFADKASFDGSVNTCEKMKEYGFNYLITCNYNFSPGSISYMKGLFDATESTGVLASFSLPHGKDYGWKLDTPKQQERYTKLTTWLIRQVQNNPSIITYAMNHNATGYYGDQNPIKMDGKYSLLTTPDVPESKLKYRRQSKIAENITKAIDPTRAVYHHQSGNLGDLYTINFYLNWAPRQERSDWMNNWATNGEKPIFFVEWGLPHIASWSSYRGPNFIWRTDAMQMLWDSEFVSSITNQKAYEMTKSKTTMQDNESALWKKGKAFKWGGHLAYMLRDNEENYLAIQAWYASDNWKSFRMKGVSAMLPWDQDGLWTRVKDTDTEVNPSRFENLKQPGIVPDFFTAGSQLIYDLQDNAYAPTSLGKTFLRWNKPIIAFIAGKSSHQTEKGGNFLQNEEMEKQLVVINDSREKISCNYSWAIDELNIKGKGSISVPAGDTKFIPVKFKISDDAKPGQYNLNAVFDFDDVDVQTDSFALNVIRKNSNKLKLKGKIALFDPANSTAAQLNDADIPFTNIDSNADLSKYQTLIIGKNAFDHKDSKIDLSKAGKLNILVLEQPYKVLANKFGFRANIMGLRQTFVRDQSHPILDNISANYLKNWHGASTLTTPYLQGLPAYETHDPKWDWCGFENTRVWRSGNEGNTASVLIEKPLRGNWLPLVDGGFNLQYAPLLEYRDDNGIIIFCQMDITSRTESEPTVGMLFRNIVTYLDKPVVNNNKKVYYAGNNKGKDFLNQLGVIYTQYNKEKLDDKSLLIVGPDSNLTNLPALVTNGGNAICIGLNAAQTKQLIPKGVDVTDSSIHFRSITDLSAPEFKGISNSDLYWRTPLSLGAIKNIDEQSNQALKKIKSGSGIIILSQLAPWMLDYEKSANLRIMYRRNAFLTSRLLANLGAKYKPTKIRSTFNNKITLTRYELPQKWVGIECIEGNGQELGWQKADFDDSAWKSINVPGPWEEQRKELSSYNGYFWYRIKFKVPEKMKNSEITLNIGAVDDESWIWLNDKYLGEITKKTNPEDYFMADRLYKLTPKELNTDKYNTLIIRVGDWYKNGGIMGTPVLLDETRPSADSYYIQKPIADDDPYRYYRW
jgi:hypothetical protein